MRFEKKEEKEEVTQPNKPNRYLMVEVVDK